MLHFTYDRATGVLTCVHISNPRWSGQKLQLFIYYNWRCWINSGFTAHFVLKQWDLLYFTLITSAFFLSNTFQYISFLVWCIQSVLCLIVILPVAFDNIVFKMRHLLKYHLTVIATLYCFAKWSVECNMHKPFQLLQCSTVQTCGNGSAVAFCRFCITTVTRNGV